MLRQLHIRNYALIEELDIPFHPGFSVITGETGAGKSIILGAIGLLLGQRATHLPSLPEGKKCTVEAHFDISNYEMNAFFTDNDIDYVALCPNKSTICFYHIENIDQITNIIFFNTNHLKK